MIEGSKSNQQLKARPRNQQLLHNLLQNQRQQNQLQSPQNSLNNLHLSVENHNQRRLHDAQLELDKLQLDLAMTVAKLMATLLQQILIQMTPPSFQSRTWHPTRIQIP